MAQAKGISEREFEELKSSKCLPGIMYSALAKSAENGAAASASSSSSASAGSLSALVTSSRTVMCKPSDLLFPAVGQALHSQTHPCEWLVVDGFGVSLSGHGSSEEGAFLKRLGVREHPEYNAMMTLCAAQAIANPSTGFVSPTPSAALTYFAKHFRAVYSAEYKKKAKVAFLPAAMRTKFTVSAPAPASASSSSSSASASSSARASASASSSSSSSKRHKRPNPSQDVEVVYLDDSDDDSVVELKTKRKKDKHVPSETSK
jgi:hypothetical protein